ncbi:MAG: cytochrome c1 [Devosiaceae bacterium]|nr:cytochrome c1 [Devosiaceae bacterium]
MNRMSRFFKSVLLAVGFGISSAMLVVPASSVVIIDAELQDWSFAGIFGRYDKNQLQRGFQVFQQSCAACHGAKQISFRNLSEEGGPSFSESQVKALAAEYIIIDAELEDGERAATPADRWPEPFPTLRDARAANSGAFPPDFSLLAKARGITQRFPAWALNYFTAYQEGGTDYIYNLLVNFTDAPEDYDVPAGQYWNAYYGSTLAMASPLFDGMIDYEGDEFPETTEQYALDVAAFMMWMAEPGLNSRKQMGFQVLIFLFVLAGMMVMVKRKIWSDVKH